eukprot:jgi/Picsp_1/5032/NSC_02395-R1_bzip transcription factor family protein
MERRVGDQAGLEMEKTDLVFEGHVDSGLSPSATDMLFDIGDIPDEILSEDLGGELDLDELLAVFGDVEGAPSEGNTGLGASPVSTGKRGNISPSTSESGNRKYYSGSDNASRGDVVQDKAQQSSDEEEKKRQARMQRNRENAQLSRLRKKQQMLELQRCCQALKAQNGQLGCFVQRLVAENCLLRKALSGVCAQSKIEVPDIPSALQPAAVQGDANLHLKRPASMGGVAMHLPVPTFNQEVNKSFSPGGTCSSAKSQTEIVVNSAGKASDQSNKRRKIGGAGAAFLALFSLFLVITPYSMEYYQPPPPSSGQAYLPTGSGASSGNKHHQNGRSLLSIQEKNEAVDLSQYFTQTVESLLEDQNAQGIPKNALQKLEDIAPAAVLLESDTHEGKRTSLDASTVFPILAKRFFESSGLDAPQKCRKVFEVDANAISHHVRNKRKIEKYLSGTYGFKGRSTGTLSLSDEDMNLRNQGNLILPEGNIVDDLDLKDAKQVPPTVQKPVSEPMIVSVLLPANSSRSSEAGISAVDHLYVVVLNPENKFTTYSCDLPKSLIF